MNCCLSSRNGIEYAVDGSVTVYPGGRSGAVSAVASKSQAHRLMICAALSSERTVVRMPEGSDDISATISCLESLGARISTKKTGCPDGSGGIAGIVEYEIVPLDRRAVPAHAELHPRESGSTLRFLAPVAAALGTDADFIAEGRLSERPMEALGEALSAGGSEIRREGNVFRVRGRLRPAAFTIPGNISSQFVSGMLFALPLLNGESTLRVTGGIESAGYIGMTLRALEKAGVNIKIDEEGRYTNVNSGAYSLSGEVTVEGDWSGAAFFLSAGALSGKGITVTGLDCSSPQGDRKIVDVLRAFGADVKPEDNAVFVRKNRLRGIDVDATDVPDLVPVIAALAMFAEGTTNISGAARLRLKESDRLAAMYSMGQSLGADVTLRDDGLTVRGRPGAIRGGRVDTFGDHRIAMSAAVAATGAGGPVVIQNAGCASKSYPGFWKAMENLDFSPDLS